MELAILGIRGDIFCIIVSQLVCLPLGAFYNVFLADKSSHLKHCFNFITGLTICYFNFGLDALHSLTTCLTIWFSIKFLGPTSLMVGLNFIIVMTYLLYGYYQKEWINSDRFTWTLPQCVLSLALIAISFDVYDGANNAKNKNENKKLLNVDTAIDKTPEFLEFFGKIYFAPSFLIGPQIGFKDYQIFCEQKNNKLKTCLTPALIRAMISLLYFSFQLLGNKLLPQTFFLSEEFASYGFLSRFTLLALGNKMILCKYISAWALSESGCILYGISVDPNTGKIDRCFNMNITLYETCTTFRTLIQSFNISTNAFAMRYIFKRLTWAGSKIFSQIITVAFLALWHGFLLGYYNTFALEIVMVLSERDWEIIILKYKQKSLLFSRILNNKYFKILLWLMMRLHILYMFSYAFTSFGFLKIQHWKYILSQLYYCGHFIYFGWIPLSLMFNTKL